MGTPEIASGSAGENNAEGDKNTGASSIAFWGSWRENGLPLDWSGETSEASTGLLSWHGQEGASRCDGFWESVFLFSCWLEGLLLRWQHTEEQQIGFDWTLAWTGKADEMASVTFPAVQQQAQGPATVASIR